MAKKILLVDDTETVLMLEKMMLSGTGHEIHVARDGDEAVTRARELNPDIMFLDIMMPGRNGIEVCRELKSDEATKAIPIVMVTTKGEPERVEEAFMAGCDDYLTKPVNKLELLAKVKTYLG
jgi:CheY-like chemotaxis protein